MKVFIKRIGLSGFILNLLYFSAYSQVPFVSSVSKNFAGSQEVITIQGVNFGTNAANIRVVFGSGTATPQAITDQLIEVKVPASAVYDNISVLNISNGLSGASRNPFLLSFGGTSPFDALQMTGQFDFDSESGLYDLAVADFDGDGKSDVATSNDNATNISAFRNTGSPGTLSFVKTVLATGAKTLHVASGDLNGDGKPEIVASEVDGARLFVFRNNSTPGNFSFTLQTITVPSAAKIGQLRIMDLDLNGKLDFIVTDHAAGRLWVAANQSTLATISFATPTEITLTGSSGTDGISVSDLDGNQLPEIVVCEFLTPTGKIFTLKNQSTPGSLSFATPQVIQAATTVSNLRIGDLDGDGKADLAATALLASGVFVFGNQSTSSAIQFAAPVLIESNERPWGIDFGDMDGDGKADITVASITQKMVTILNNQSTSGSFNFVKSTKTTSFINRHIRTADMDGDGRTDIAFTSIDDKNLGIPSSKISIFRNINCVTPSLKPVGPVTICSGFTQRLTASDNAGGLYEWFKDAVSLGAPSATSFFDATATGSYTVTLTNGTCSKTSTAVQINVTAGAPLGAVTPNPVSPVCIGGTLNLSVNNVGATDYVWTGPASFTANGVSVSRANFQTAHAGRYTVEVMVGSCITQRASIVVDAVDVPGVAVSFSGSDIICEGQTKQFSLFPTVTGYTYQWAEQTSGDITGATGSTYTASSTGSYFVKLTSIASPSCPAISTTAKKVRIAKIPIVDFAAPSAACTGQAVNFTDQSTVDNDPGDPLINYQWDFGDATTATTANASHTFTTAQSFNVKLTISYRNQSCPASKTKILPVQVAPTVSITSATNTFTFCPGKSLTLQVTGAPITSYTWSTGATTPTVSVNQAGNISVEVITGACKLTASKVITQFPVTDVAASADPAAINVGGSSQLNVTGLTSTFLWRPNKKDLSDSLIANPVASPLETTTYTVTGKDLNGCDGQATVELIVIPDNVLSILRPEEFFSPNGDGVNDRWVVENAPTQNTCSIAVYDERGLKVFEAKPYLNDWEGISSRGKVLPAGVYYYVIKCDDLPKKHLAGSVNIVR